MALLRAAVELDVEEGARLKTRLGGEVQGLTKRGLGAGHVLEQVLGQVLRFGLWSLSVHPELLRGCALAPYQELGLILHQVD